MIDNTDLLFPIRPLSGVEIMMSCMHNLMRGTTQATQVLEISESLPFDSYQEASRMLLKEFPILGACIRDYEDKTWFFSGANCRDVPVTCQTASDKDESDNIISSLVDNPLSQERSLWRITVLNIKETPIAKIVMTIHHAILDGNGLSVVGTRFLHYLDKYQSREAVDVSTRKFPPSINDFLSRKSTPPPPIQGDPLPYDVAIPIQDRKTAWQSMKIGPDLRNCLESQAREDKVHYNSILSAALIKSISDSELYAEPIELKSAVSLRIFDDMETTEISDLGCYMGISSTQHTARNRGIAELAKQYEVGLLRDSVKRCFAKAEYTSKDISLCMANSLCLNSFTGGIGITNIGDIAIPHKYGNFELTDYFTTVNRVGGTYFLVVHRYSFKQIDTIQFVYTEPLVPEFVVDQLARSFRHHLMVYGQMSIGDRDQITHQQ